MGTIGNANHIIVSKSIPLSLKPRTRRRQRRGRSGARRIPAGAARESRRSHGVAAVRVKPDVSWRESCGFASPSFAQSSNAAMPLMTSCSSTSKSHADDAEGSGLPREEALRRARRIRQRGAEQTKKTAAPRSGFVFGTNFAPTSATCGACARAQASPLSRPQARPGYRRCYFRVAIRRLPETPARTFLRSAAAPRPLRRRLNIDDSTRVGPARF